LRAAQASWLPTASFVLEQGAIGASNDRLYNTYSYGVQFSLPVFDGMKRASQWSEARAQSDLAIARRREIERDIDAEVRSALARLSAADERGAAATASVRLADEAVRQATSRFEAGLAGNADVIEAQQARTRAKSELIEAMAARQQARVALSAARGEVKIS
jgi:outer membrane protein TolC